MPFNFQALSQQPGALALTLIWVVVVAAVVCGVLAHFGNKATARVWA